MKYRLILFLIGVVLMATLAPGAAAANEETAEGKSFVLHLVCDNGVVTDILVPSGGSYAGLVLESNGVGVLKGIDANADGVLEFLVPGFEQGDLTECAAFSEVAGEFSFVFVAYVLFTPQSG